MNSPIKNMLVGIFILAAISASVATIMFLKPTIGDGKQTLNVRFSDIGSINIGTRVRFAGRPIGEVAAIEEIKDARQQPTDELGRVYFYQLVLHIDSSVKVYNTDEISIQTSGLMGEKSISITPKAPAKGITPKLIGTKPIYADSVDAFQNALVDFSDLTACMEDTFSQISLWIKSHGEEVATMINSTGHAIQEMDRYHTFENAGITMENLKTASNAAAHALEEISKGKGTVGKLVNSDDLYLQLNAVMTKANNLMNDVTQYGVLFHLNKQWQRTHLQKVNHLDALKNPQSFRVYFQNEVDDINSSMTRLSMLIQKADGTNERREILQSPAFRRDFAELLRRCEELSENLKLYNQQLIEALQN